MFLSSNVYTLLRAKLLLLLLLILDQQLQHVKQLDAAVPAEAVLLWPSEVASRRDPRLGWPPN